ncbi:MAG TPA: ABC transporter substrate-binding protein [bacterium]|nr:ABC transporter substrate-binding protein [bacterium]
MIFVLKRLFLGFFLIALAASALLISDLDRRVVKKEVKIHKIALFIFSSRPTLEDGQKGVIDALAENGFVEGDNISIRKYNAEGDMNVANSIAKEITSGMFDMAITLSTPSLQTTANANKTNRIRHIFGIVTHPAGAGVGISEEPLSHPDYIAGYGTFQPVDEVFELIKKINPDLKKVGVVWTPSEACSAACLSKARIIAKKLNIELLESTIDNSSAIYEAASALVQRGVEAIWIGGDNVVELGAFSVIEAAKKGKIPVFTNNTDHLKLGSFLSLGANYYNVGKETGRLASEALNGTPLSSMPIKNMTPPQLAINLKSLENTKGKWRVPEDILNSADIIANEDGKEIIKNNSAVNKNTTEIFKPQKKWNLAILRYTETLNSDEAIDGIKKGLADKGLKQDENYDLKILSAQNELTVLNSLVSSLENNKPDLIFTITTQATQALIKKFGGTNVPIVFSYLADPKLAGLGESNEKHISNVTGAWTTCDYENTIKLLVELMPGIKKIGTLYSTNELNSDYHYNNLLGYANKAKIEFIRIGVNTSSDIADAATALCSKKIDAVLQVMDNLTDVSFAKISDVCKKQKIPIFGFSSSNVEDGAILALCRDFYTGGLEAAYLADKIIKGMNPADIPFKPILKSNLEINAESARYFGLKIPEKILKQAEKIHNITY